MKLTEKNLTARRTLQRRRDAQDRKDREADTHNHPDCVVKGDAMYWACDAVDRKQLSRHPDWHRESDSYLKRGDADDFLPYGRIARYRSTKTQSKVWVYYNPRIRNLANCRIGLFPDDSTGLLPQEVASVLENVMHPVVAKLEVSTDFGISTGVDAPYIRRHFISGKCTPDGADQWGRRTGTKFIRSYFKKEIGAHRLELQLNWRFLRTNSINTIFDFPKLAELLPVHHIWFARIDDLKVVERLRKTRAAKRTVKILKKVNEAEGDLHAQLQILKRAGVTNTRRLLAPLEINRVATQALEKWARLWPSSPVSLDGDAGPNQTSD